MDPNARRGYRLLATLFLVVGGAFGVLALLQRIAGRQWLNGDPLGIALLVFAIGGALWWTVRSAPDAAESDRSEADAPGPDEADTVGTDADRTDADGAAAGAAGAGAPEIDVRGPEPQDGAPAPQKRGAARGPRREER